MSVSKLPRLEISPYPRKKKSGWIIFFDLSGKILPLRFKAKFVSTFVNCSAIILAPFLCWSSGKKFNFTLRMCPAILSCMYFSSNSIPQCPIPHLFKITFFSLILFFKQLLSQLAYLICCSSPVKLTPDEAHLHVRFYKPRPHKLSLLPRKITIPKRGVQIKPKSRKNNTAFWQKIYFD